MNYGKKSAQKQSAKLSSKRAKNKKRFGITFIKTILVCILCIIAVGLVAGGLYAVKLIKECPDISEVNISPNGFSTTVLDSAGNEIETLAASGSESSNSCVLTNEETKEKRGITSETNRPRISFLDPENTYTVSKFQTGCGIVDIMMHTLERYLTPEGGESDITDRIAEGLLIAVRDAGRRAIANPRDYEARASLMWAGSVSHNDYTGCGRKRLFPVHKLEHELSAFRDEIAHGAGLSVLFPAWALYEMKNDFPRFAQLANRVFGVEMDFHHPERTAREGILTMKRFFEEIGMPTHLSQLGIKPENYAQLAANTVRTVKGPVKSYSALDEQAIIEIYKLAE